MIWPLLDDEWNDIPYAVGHTDPGSREVVKRKWIEGTIICVLKELRFSYGVVINVHCKYDDGSRDVRMGKTVFRGTLGDVKSRTEDIVKKIYYKCNMRYYTHTTFELFVFKNHNLIKVTKDMNEHFKVVAA